MKSALVAFIALVPGISRGATQQVLSIVSPVTLKEKSGSDLVEVDTSKADLELRLWQVSETYNFESIIDARQANQAILPTDERGRLIKDAVVLGDRPYIRYYPPGKDPVTIDVNCDKKRCRALWKKAPFDPKKPQTFKIEVNIRGMKGRHWEAGYNQLLTHPENVTEIPKDKNLPARTSLFNLESFWPEQEFGEFKRAAAQNEFVEMWNFPEGEKLETGFRKFTKLTRYAILDGALDLEITNGSYLERRRIPKGTSLWFLPGQIASLRNAGPPYVPAKVLRLEFQKASP